MGQISVNWETSKTQMVFTKGIVTMLQLLELAQLVNGTLNGADQSITGVATIANAGKGLITFATTQQHYDDFCSSDAAAVVISPDICADSDRSAIVVDDVISAFSEVVKQFRPPAQQRLEGIHPAAVISDSAIIEDGACIHANAVVMDGAKIGAGTVLYPNVTVMENCSIGANCKLFPGSVLYENTVVGDRVVLHAGVVIGAWGFGYESSAAGHQISAQLGNVVIESDVELGANTTIDRGTFDSTVVGAGTKMDNQVMIGHNCRIGKHNLLCSQVGIAGSCTTGDFVVMGGQVGLGDHLNIGDNVQIGAKSGLMQDVESNKRVMGTPARSIRQTMQFFALQAKLPSMRKDLLKLQKQFEELQGEIQQPARRNAA